MPASGPPYLEGKAAVENDDDLDLNEHVQAVVALAAVWFAHQQHEEVGAGERDRQLRRVQRRQGLKTKTRHKQIHSEDSTISTRSSPTCQTNTFE